MKQLISVVFFLLGLITFAQDSIVVVYTISDENNGLVENVRTKVYQNNWSSEYFSDDQGQVVFSILKSGELKAVFRHLNYSKLTVIEEIYQNTSLDTLRFKVRMNSMQSLELNDVTVTFKRAPEVIFKSEILSVQDYEFVSKNELLLLTYPKQLKKGSRLILYDVNGGAKDSLEIAGRAIEITRDYEGNIYLITSLGCKKIVVDDDLIKAEHFDLEYLNTYVLPIVSTTSKKMFFSNYNKLYPAFNYYYLNIKDSAYTKFASVIDEEMMVQFRSDYKFADHYAPGVVRRKLEAKNYELATGIDAEIYWGMKYFTHSIYYKPAFAPMFSVKKQLYLFDYQCDSLKIFDNEGIAIKNIAIDHDHNEKKRGWSGQLIHDRTRNTVYAVYERGGFYYLNRIDLSTGKLGTEFKLTHRYTDEIQVQNGYVYYVYRPFESAQKKILWRERIKRD
jgi:hypothetical protein